jgi:Ni,Fe-hydrogenase III large subunit
MSESNDNGILSHAHRVSADPLAGLIARLDESGVVTRRLPAGGFNGAGSLEVNPGDWGTVARTAHELEFRWVAGWVLDECGESRIFQPTTLVCFEKEGRYLVLRARLAAGLNTLPSHSPWFPGARRSERHSRDAFGVEFSGHPDPRPWLRHQAWGAHQFPLRKSFSAAGAPPAMTQPDNNYPFESAHGSGVYEIPVGPVHAGIIEPGHFRFTAVGEQVLNLEERLGYVHKGIEKLAEGRDPVGLARLAGRVSGDTTVAHAWAACMAMERAAGIEPPQRAQILRAILVERERVANHLGDIGALCNDVAYTFANYQFTRLRERWLRNNRNWFGHRLLMDCVIPGGTRVDPSEELYTAIFKEEKDLRRELDELRPILEDNDSLQDRLTSAGILPAATAKALGCLGYVARASGVAFDLRRDAPYGPYDLVEVNPVCRHTGDVRARLDVRYDEIHDSLKIIIQLMNQLEPGSVVTEWRTPKPESEGMGLVEGWRGEIFCYIRFGSDNGICRYFPRDPSVFNWLALERLIHGNIVPDFPLCNKSVNASYSGHDL